MRTQEKGISIVVAARGGPENLQRLLEGLCKQTVHADKIIIVHTAPKRIPQEILGACNSHFPLEYFHEPGKSLASARNMGIAVSKEFVLAFLTDDCVPCESWVEAILLAFSNNSEVLVLQGSMIYGSADRSFHTRFQRADGTRDIRRMLDETSEYISTLDARNFAIRGDIIRRFRMPFDERLSSNEDIEFWWKLRQEGIQIAFCREMQVTCYQNGSLFEYLLSSYRQGIGKEHVKRIHDDFWDYQYASVQSLRSFLSQIVGEARSSRFREYFRELLRERRLVDALKLYPLAVVQRMAFALGLLRGRTVSIPDYDDFVTPIDLLFIVTNRCNMRCRHCCFHDRLDGPVREITADHVVRVLDSLNRDLRTVSIAGGEPFLAGDLVQICKALSERIHVKNVYIVTNGFHTSRIVETCAKILETANFNLNIRVSLDGLPDTHNGIRRDGQAFAKVVETIEGLRELAKGGNRLQVEIQTTVGRHNFDELGQLAEYVTKNFKLFHAFEITRDSEMSARIPGFIEHGYGPGDPTTLLTRDQLEEVRDYVRGIYDRSLQNGYFSSYQKDFQTLLVDIGSRQSLHNKRVVRCTAGESVATIFENLDVAICEMTSPIGNLAEFDFDLKRLMQERFGREMRMRRDSCHCANSCNISSSILTARISPNHDLKL